MFTQIPDELGALAAALSKAQADAESAIKNQKNSHFRSSYADLSSVLDVAKPALAKHGLAFMTMPSFDPETATAKMQVILMLSDSDQRITFESAIPISKHDAHGVASGWTYLRRYCVSAILNLSTDDDDDGNAATAKPAPNAKPKAKKPAAKKRKATPAFEAKTKPADKKEAEELEAELKKLERYIAAAEAIETADAKTLEICKKVLEAKGEGDPKRSPLEYTKACIEFLLKESE
jgi:hypothetical protein